MASNIENRIIKLESRRGAKRRTYVVHVSDHMTKKELAELAAARAEGRPVAIMPHACADWAEWVARYGYLRLPR